jgi:hypothetical protein
MLVVGGAKAKIKQVHALTWPSNIKDLLVFEAQGASLSG